MEPFPRRMPEALTPRLYPQIQRTTPTRALPDPQFTFEADIADTLMTFMPGLMFDFMTRGKRSAMGREMIASSNVAYRVYVTAVLSAAASSAFLPSAIAAA